MSAAIDPGYAIALKNDALYLRAPTSSAAWAAQSNEKKSISPLASHDDAAAEALRQAEFMGGPMVRDRAIVKGARADLIGRPILLGAPGLGYEAGAACFVIGAQEGDSETTLTVVRRLA